jgi:hypothetical protein
VWKIAAREQHEVRKRIAKAIVKAAREGKFTLGALTQAAEYARARPQQLAKMT